MAIQILEIEQNTEEWLKAREGKVTGSNAGQLLTIGLDEALKCNYARFRGNYYTQRGHILEIEALEVYAAVHGAETLSRPGMVVNDKYPNASCSPDGIDGEYLLEVKALSEIKHLDIVNSKVVPFKIMSQIQFNMMICELKRARLIMYNPDIEDPKKAYCEIEIKAQPKIWSNFKVKLAAR